MVLVFLEIDAGIHTHRFQLSALPRHFARGIVFTAADKIHLARHSLQALKVSATLTTALW
jgi:hypothetical protein